MRFRKLPIEVEAAQVVPSLFMLDTGSWPCNNPFGALEMRRPHWWQSPVPMIRTLEGWLTVSPYDWIIKGIKGEFYPCKPDIFAEIYEEVSE